MNNLSSYTKAYDSLTYTPEQKAALASHATTAAGTRSRKKNPVPFLLKAAATAVCLLSIITITAEAAGLTTPVSELLAPLFGRSAAQCEIIDTIGRPVDAMDTDNGVTIQADAIMGDGHNVSILFTIRRDDGTPLLPAGVTASQLFLGDGSDIRFNITGGQGTSVEFIDTVPGDQELQLLYKISASSRLLGETCTAVFDGLYRWNNGTQTAEAAVSGHWELQFEMDYEDSALTLESGQVFMLDDMTATIQEVFLSPIAIHVAYDVEVSLQDAPGKLEGELTETLELLESVPIQLIKTDGTVIATNRDCSTTVLPGDGVTHIYRSAVFESVLPIDSLESITVGDIVFPLNAE